MVDEIGFVAWTFLAIARPLTTPSSARYAFLIGDKAGSN